jgi:hypothetical protein
MHITVLLEHLSEAADDEGSGGWVGRLREIDLSYNAGLGDLAVAELAAGFHRCCPLLFSLDIRGVSARTHGALSWGRALKAERYADLSQLWIEDDAASSGLQQAGRRAGVHPNGWSGNAIADRNVLRSIAQMVGANCLRHAATPVCAALQRVAWARVAATGLSDDLIQSIGLLLAVPGLRGVAYSVENGSSQYEAERDWARDVTEASWWRVEALGMRGAVMERYLQQRAEEEESRRLAALPPPSPRNRGRRHAPSRSYATDLDQDADAAVLRKLAGIAEEAGGGAEPSEDLDAFFAKRDRKVKKKRKGKGGR